MEPDDVARAPWPRPGAVTAPPPGPAAAPEDTAPPAATESAAAAPDDTSPLAPESRPARDIPEPPVTGDPQVDGAAAEAAAALTEPLEAQLAAYERAHRALQDRLADVEG